MVRLKKTAEPEEPYINTAKAPEPVPEGMVWVPGGRFFMGSEDFEDAMPIHMVTLDGYWMDKTEVTNAQYAKFVEATGYKTVAERQPELKYFPNYRPEFSGSKLTTR